LEEHSVSGARRNAELLLCHVLGLDRLGLYLNHERPLTETELDRCRALLRRRGAHEPLQYITGRTSFRHLELLTGPGVLIPRPETEMLVDLTLKRLQKIAGENAASPLPRVLDLCCGSGAVGLSLAVEHPEAEYTLSDISPIALGWAVKNSRLLSSGASRVSFCLCDLMSSFRDQPSFDLIVANPPYVSPSEMLSLPDEIRLFEPVAALDGGGEDGTGLIDVLVAQAVPRLRNGGLLALETGENQHSSLDKIFAGHAGKLSAVTFHRDLSGRERFVTACRRND
jgi:release factor glutamine methyltransferase